MLANANLWVINIFVNNSKIPETILLTAEKSALNPLSPGPLQHAPNFSPLNLWDDPTSSQDTPQNARTMDIYIRWWRARGTRVRPFI